MDVETLLELVEAELSPPGKSQPVLSGVTLRLVRGEVAVVMGKNGSGKSTLLRSLAGLWPLRRGTLRPPALQGFDPRRAGLTLEDPSSQLVASRVDREVEFGLENLGLWPEQVSARCRDVLQLFDLTKLASRDAHTMSPGEQERVLLAATLAPAPPVLLLDDPFLYLGPRESRSAWKQVVAAVRQGSLGAVLLATHEIEVGQASDRAGILAGGRLVTWGDPEKVLEDAIRGSLL